MNICHVNLARGFSGGESQTLLLIKAQIAQGDSLTIIAKQGSPFADACRTLDCTLIETRSYLSKHCRTYTEHCTAVHVHEGQAIYWAFIQYLFHRTPYIVTRRIDNPFKNKWLSRKAYANAACIVGVSHAVESVVKNTFPRARTNIVHDSPVAYPVNAGLLNSLRNKYEGKFVVIQAAKLYQHKGYDVTIQAAKLLSNRSDIQFCLLGDGPEQEKLQAMAEGQANVEFLGRQTEMGAWFALANTVVLPSHTEGMGSVLLEATLAGAPVIGSRAGGIPDAIQEGVNGLLVDIGNPDSLAHAILRIKDEPLLREQINQQAPHFIDEFSIQKAAKRYAYIYEDSAKS